MLETQCGDYSSFFATPPEGHIPSLALPFLANSVLIQPLLEGELKNKNNPSRLYRAVQSAFMHLLSAEPHKNPVKKVLLPFLTGQGLVLTEVKYPARDSRLKSMSLGPKLLFCDPKLPMESTSHQLSYLILTTTLRWLLPILYMRQLRL